MAGRIPQSFVDNLLDRVDIVELIDSRVKLKKSGKNYMACCPFHDEKSPSFSVNSDKQFYHCFGCGASGNAIGFLMEYEHQGFPEAVDYLAQKHGLQVPRESGGLDQEQQQQRLDAYGILEKASRYYQEQLRSHAQATTAQDYLKGRGLTGQIAHQFGIGYAPPGWDNLLKFLGADTEGKALLNRSGMLVEKEEDGKIYDRFRHRIMFPIRDVRGRVIGFGGRVLNDDKPKYLNSPETDVFHKGRELYGLYEAIQANRHLERVLVVEGYMDVVALAQYGVSFATATLGTAASETHLEKAFRHAPEVVFCFDGDEAGTRAARRALEVALPVLGDGRQVRFMFLPAGEDPDTLIRKHGKDDFLQRMKNATPLSEFLFDVAGEGLNLATPEGRAQLITRLLPSLRRIPDGAYKGQLTNLLAHKGQTDIHAINNLLEKTSSDLAQEVEVKRSPDGGEVGEKRRKFVQPNRPASTLPVKKLSQLSEALDEVTALLLKQPALVDQYEAELYDLGGVLEAERLLRLADLWRDQPGASPSKILDSWQKLYGPEDANYFYKLDGREFLLDSEIQARKFSDILGSLQKILRESEMQALIDKARTQGLSEPEIEQLNTLLKGG